MKTVKMLRDFPYCPSLKVTIQYRNGVTYQRVPEAAVRAILAADAGEIQESINSKLSVEISKQIP